MAKFEATALVQSQQSTTIDIVLSPSGTQTVVRVEDVTPMVITDSPDQKHTLDHTRIDQLPLNDPHELPDSAAESRSTIPLAASTAEIASLPFASDSETDADV